MLSVHDIILDTYFHKSQSYLSSPVYDKNTVRKDVKCQFIAYYVIGGTLVYIVVCQIEIDKKCKCQLLNSDRVRTNL